MKCISCGNEIPNSSTICPFCGKDVKPVESGAVPTYNTPDQQDFNAVPLVKQEDMPMQSAPVNDVPATPDSPVLPQDQGLQTAPVAPAVPVGSEVTPKDVAIPPIPGSEEKKEAKADIGTNPPVVPATSGVMTNPSTPEAATISNQGEMLDGVRESSSTLVEDEKKKTKKKKTVKLVIIIIVVLVLIAGGGFGYAYYTQTQTSTTRLNSIIDQVIKFDNNLNQTLKQTSGKYNLSGEITFREESYAAKVSGIYAYDIEKKIMDYTLNLEQLDFGKDKLIDKDPLNVELYLADSNVYVLFQNFYDKYIYEEVPGMDEAFENVSKNEINYTLILNGLKTAVKSGINAASKSQTAKNIKIGDIDKKANVITINLNSANVKKIATATLRNIANNANLLNEIAKASEELNADKIKEEIETEIKDMEDPEIKDPVKAEIYTAMFGNEFYGIRLTGSGDDKDSKLEVYPIADGYKIVLVDDKNEVLNLSYTHKKQRSSSEIEENYGIDAVLSIDKEVLKVKLEYKNVADVTPKVERVNTKESIKMENIPETDQSLIIQKVYNFGNLGLMVKSYIESQMNNGINGGNNITIPDSGNGNNQSVNPNPNTDFGDNSTGGLDLGL